MEGPNYESHLWKVRDEDLEWGNGSASPAAKIDKAPKSGADAEKNPGIKANLREPDTIEGKRQVAMSRVIGTDHPAFKKADNGRPLDSSSIFRHFSEKLNEENKEAGPTIEKTPEQKEIIDFISKNLPAFLAKYGLEKPVNIPESAVRIADTSRDERERNRLSGFTAQWRPIDQGIVVNGEGISGMNDLHFAEVVTHEYLHANAFISVNVHKGKDMKNSNGKNFKSRVRRSGLVNYVTEKRKDGSVVTVDYFAEIDEAVTEILARRFIVENLHLMPHAEAAREEIVEKLESRYREAKERYPGEKVRVTDNATGIEYGDPKSGSYRIFKIDSAYEKQIDDFREEAEHLCEKAQEYRELVASDPSARESDEVHEALLSFKNREDVLKFFSHAYFSGRQLTLAKVLSMAHDNTSFRQLGRRTNLWLKRQHVKKRKTDDNSQPKRS